MRQGQIRTSLMAAAAALALAACGGGATADDDGDSGGGDGGGGAAESITIEASEFAFDPADFSVTADTDTDIVLENTGVVEHDITVDELDLQIHADGSTTTTETVSLPAGTYTFYCSIPGHRESGMEGTLTVEG